MSLSALTCPQHDPTAIFELFRGNYAAELLTVSVAHLRVFDLLAADPLTIDELRNTLGLAERPATVLITALRAMQLLSTDSRGQLTLTSLASEHLLATSLFDVSNYIRLAADEPGVLNMLERLRSNRPAGTNADEPGAAFLFREGHKSAMDEQALARQLTLALAGRAKNVAPHLATRLPLPGVRRLLDVGGGTGIYSIAWLQQHPQLRAVVWDRPEVLKVAEEMATAYGVSDRVELCPGDMFRDPVPGPIDAVLLSNILHDWDVPECRQLIGRCANALPAGGRLLIHDVFLNDALDGPLPIALYSAALFSLTEGRAYSSAEYRGWLEECHLTPRPVVPTLIHCGVLEGVKQS